MNNDKIKQFCKTFNVNRNVMKYMIKLKNITNNFNIEDYQFVKSVSMTNHDYLPLAIKYFTDYCNNIANMPSVTFNNVTDILHRHSKKDVWTLESWFRKARDYWWTNDSKTVFKRILDRITPDRDGLINNYYRKYKNACNNLYDLVFHDAKPIILGRVGEDYVYSNIKRGIDKYNTEYQLSSNLNDSFIWKDTNLYFKYPDAYSNNNNNQLDIIIVNAGGVFIFEVKTLSSPAITINNNGDLIELAPYGKNFTECNIEKQENNHINTIKNIIKDAHINLKFIHSKMVWVRGKNCKYKDTGNFSKPFSSNDCVKYMIDRSKEAILNPQQISFIIKKIKSNEIHHELDLSKSGQANDTGIKHKHLIENNKSIIDKFYQYVYLVAALSALKRVHDWEI